MAYAVSLGVKKDPHPPFFFFFFFFGWGGGGGWGQQTRFVTISLQMPYLILFDLEQ